MGPLLLPRGSSSRQGRFFLLTLLWLSSQCLGFSSEASLTFRQVHRELDTDIATENEPEASSASLRAEPTGPVDLIVPLTFNILITNGTTSNILFYDVVSQLKAVLSTFTQDLLSSENDNDDDDAPWAAKVIGVRDNGKLYCPSQYGIENQDSCREVYAAIGLYITATTFDSIQVQQDFEIMFYEAILEGELQDYLLYTYPETDLRILPFLTGLSLEPDTDPDTDIVQDDDDDDVILPTDDSVLLDDDNVEEEGDDHVDNSTQTSSPTVVETEADGDDDHIVVENPPNSTDVTDDDEDDGIEIPTPDPSVSITSPPISTPAPTTVIQDDDDDLNRDDDVEEGSIDDSTHGNDSLHENQQDDSNDISNSSIIAIGLGIALLVLLLILTVACFMFPQMPFASFCLPGRRKRHKEEWGVIVDSSSTHSIDRESITKSGVSPMASSEPSSSAEIVPDVGAKRLSPTAMATITPSLHQIYGMPSAYSFQAPSTIQDEEEGGLDLVSQGWQSMDAEDVYTLSSFGSNPQKSNPGANSTIDNATTYTNTTTHHDQYPIPFPKHVTTIGKLDMEGIQLGFDSDISVATSDVETPLEVSSVDGGMSTTSTSPNAIATAIATSTPMLSVQHQRNSSNALPPKPYSILCDQSDYSDQEAETYVNSSADTSEGNGVSSDQMALGLSMMSVDSRGAEELDKLITHGDWSGILNIAAQYEQKQQQRKKTKNTTIDTTTSPIATDENIRTDNLPATPANDNAPTTFE